MGYELPQVALPVSSIRRRGGALRYLAAAGLIACLALWGAPEAGARTFRPQHHRIFHGVTDTGHVRDYRVFNRRVRAHNALLMDLYHWNTPLTTGALDRWQATHTRGVLSLSTAPGNGRELASPRAIARGNKDRVYIRLFPEMNGSWNPYCAYNSNGSRRGRSHSTSSFRRAWRRIAIIIHGGKRRQVNHRLRRAGLVRIYRASSNHARVYRHRDVPHRLPHPKVAFMWNPQTIGSPAVHGNRPGAYWPGGKYVDWVGADIYSAYATPGIWSAYKRFYRSVRHRPFVVGES